MRGDYLWHCFIFWSSSFFLLFAFFVVTQIVIPLWLGVPAFPLFRRLGKLEKELADAKGDLEGYPPVLIMSADGALEKKLDYWLKGQQVWAEAVKDYKGNWVPSVVMSGNGQSGRAGSGAQDLVDLLTIKTAKELSLDFTVPKK